MNKILLMGNPNVGKSVIFSRLTGVKVIVSNYPGTTIEFSQGRTLIDSKEYQVIDLPGIYSLHAENEAEQVAMKMLDDLSKENSDFLILNIIDATNLERNINLTLELLMKKVPMIIVLNLWDETKHKGIEIDIEKLKCMLGLEVVPTVALTGEGIKELTTLVASASSSSFDCKKEEKWEKAGQIVDSVQKLHHKHHTFLQMMEEISIHPISGIPIAALVLFGVFYLIRTIGEGFIAHIGDPLFEGLWKPIVFKLSDLLGSGGAVHDILVGRLINGDIDFSQSLGLLSTGLYIPLVAVLPYVFAFYLVLSFLEDFGYLPRLSILVDNVMHRLGVHGYSVIPFMLGFGCNVPGMLATRVMETKRERFIVATLMSITVPCMAQTAMIISLLGPYGVKPIAMVFGILFIVAVLLGLLLNQFMKGNAPELFIEIPPYRLPHGPAMFKKVVMRVSWFIKEALPWVLVGVLFVNLLYMSGTISFLAELLKPVVSGLMGLPGDAVGAMIVGFLRKDMAVGMLIPLSLSPKQMIIASVVLTMYFPCMATFTTFLKEFGLWDTLKSASIMIISSVFVGTLLNLVF